MSIPTEFQVGSDTEVSPNSQLQRRKSRKRKAAVIGNSQLNIGKFEVAQIRRLSEKNFLNILNLEVVETEATARDTDDGTCSAAAIVVAYQASICRFLDFIDKFRFEPTSL